MADAVTEPWEMPEAGRLRLAGGELDGLTGPMTGAEPSAPRQDRRRGRRGLRRAPGPRVGPAMTAAGGVGRSDAGFGAMKGRRDG
jgi:hypothetical protein